MTVGIYEIQSEAARLCSDAEQAFVEPYALSKVEAVADLAIARLFSLVACAKSFADTVFVLWRRAVKIIAIPFLDFFSLNSVVRSVIATVLGVTLTGLRIVSSLAGVISPELTYGVLRLHRFLLRLGLIYRSQFSYVGTLPPPLNQLEGRINDQRWRWGIVTNALERIDDVEVHHRLLPREGFGIDVWSPAERHALAEELTFIVEEFGRPVQVPHPILEEFQKSLPANFHSAALELCRQGMYTKDEVEDMGTAFLAVMYRATYKSIVASFRLIDRELSVQRDEIILTRIQVGDGQRVVLKDVRLEDGRQLTVKEEPVRNGAIMRSVTLVSPIGISHSSERRALQEGERVCLDDLVLADGRRVEGTDAGGLEDWKSQLIEILLLCRGMSAADLFDLSFYLCNDEERLARARADLPMLSARPALDRCFKLIVEFYTTFVAHHMPSSATAMQEAFSLPEIANAE